MWQLRLEKKQLRKRWKLRSKDIPWGKAAYTAD
jgi:hypothetical protein